MSTRSAWPRDDSTCGAHTLSAWEILARVISVMCGAVPASVLALWSLFALAFGLAALFGGEPMFGSILVFSALGGWMGTYSLWVVSLSSGKPSRFAYVGLLLGVSALVLAHVYFIQTPEISLRSPTRLWLFVAPGVVALAHLVAWFRKR